MGRRRTRLSDPIIVKDHINRAYSEMSKVRHVTKDYLLAGDEWKEFLNLFMLLGKIRSDQLHKEEIFGK